MKFLLLVRKADRVGEQAFGTYMTERYPASFAKAPGVVKLRVQLLGPHDNGTAPNKLVKHTKAPGDQYQAMVEVGFRDRLHMARALRSKEFTSTAKEQAEHIRQLHYFIQPSVMPSRPTHRTHEPGPIRRNRRPKSAWRSGARP